MLDTSHADDIISHLWDACTEKAQLPANYAVDYFDRAGPLPPSPDDRRHRPRFFCRVKAVLKAVAEEELMLGVYCRDLSQEGVGILSPRQLLPLQYGRLYLSPKKTVTARVRNCRRLGKNCYLLGCDFETDEDGGPSLW